MKRVKLFEQFVNESYKKVPYDKKIAGEYQVMVGNQDVKVKVAGFEREDDTSDSLYLMDDDKFKGKFGSFIVKNSDMPKLEKGTQITCKTSKGEDAKIKRIGDLSNQELNEKETGTDNLEIIGPSVEELFDAINKLNGAQLSGEVFKFRDNVKLKPVDKTGHVRSSNEFSIEVIPTKGFKGSMPDENDYIRETNKFLEKIGFKCKIYKTK